MTTLLPTRWTTRFPTFAWRDIDGFEDRLRRLFEEPLAFGETEPFGWVPAVDVAETDEEMILTAELPGLTEDDVEIDLEGNMLTIRGEKKEETEKEEAKGERKMRIFERRYGAFSRSFTLPPMVEAEKIAAEVENGVLRVHMPKTSEARGRRIAVKSKK